MLIIEHDMDVAKQADWVVDLGPDGGAGGGRILFAGTPEGLAESDTPTSRFLAEALARDAGAPSLGLRVREIDLDALAGDPVDADEVADDPELTDDEALGAEG